MKQTLKSRKGFTLLEILLVVAAIAILAGIVIIAINPTKQLGDTRNAQRSMDVNSILNAVYQQALDNKGVLPAGITATATPICKTGGTCTGLVDLGVLVPDYLVTIPNDPQAATINSTGYEISTTGNNRVTVNAPGVEGVGKTISVTR